MKIGVLTISDRSSAGERADEGGPLVGEIIAKIGEVAVTAVVPDDVEAIVHALSAWADAGTIDLIITTGGTGLGPRDVTPEATKKVIEREAPGIAEAMRAAGLEKTPFAALSRQVAGTRGATLIVNVPGSLKAIREGLEAVLEVLPHAVEMMHGASPA
ncbi:MAG: molybdenum cofactor biosynthesis protein B [Actinomycetota bacterium]|nr:MogA/MoaB family molybdenum cofactor biosynthesis protein [Actinomycetota bacterium]